jgi:ATPase subunit of ABC transporter with duplicated ATPase domains
MEEVRGSLLALYCKCSSVGSLTHEDSRPVCFVTRFDKPTDSLSSGERRKLFIGRMIAARPHVLILDEPTNHVSLDVLDGLERALAAFSGAVIAASHDRYFISQFAGEIWEISGGQLIQKSPPVVGEA